MTDGQHYTESILSLSAEFLALGRSTEVTLTFMMSLELRSVTSIICGEIEGLQMARGVVYTASITSSTTSLGTPSTERMEQPQILMAM